MKKKVLFVATVLRGHILVFHVPYMHWFQQQGYEVHVCARNDTGAAVSTVPGCDKYVDLPFERSPVSPGNRKVYRQLKELMDTEQYALIHCHTPVGGMLGRLAARAARKRGTRVVYTAHGFHFFTGAKLPNWLLFYPAERWLARYTDLLITINGEDYARAQGFKAKKTALVHGVGVDMARFGQPIDGASVREALGVPQDASVVITVGEHSLRKNHETVLRAVAKLPGAWLLLCGVGEREEELKALAVKLKIEQRTLFLGFREDIPALLKASDVFMFPSYQEGLPASLMEAMAAGLPCAVSDVRGNRDLIRQGEGGMLRAPTDAEGFSQDIAQLLADDALCTGMGARNQREVRAYSLPAVLLEMERLYQAELAEGGGA